MVDRPDGSTEVKITNPWDTTSLLNHYILVNKNSSSKPGTANGTSIIEVPVSSALVYSEVHTSPLEELGVSNIISGVADGEYFTSKYLKNKLNKGEIVDVGSSMSVSLEKIIELSPEIALISPYENSGHGVIDKSGTAIIDMADYMESTPLGRAEWILLLGALTGKLDAAKEIFNNVLREYELIKVSNKNSTFKPIVLTELPYGDIWYQPGGKSYMAQLIHDAGGKTIQENDSHVGSLQMDIANAFELGHNADVWIIKSDKPLFSKYVTDATPFAKQIKAFQTGNVWYVNTSASSFYKDLAFHPEKILKDYSAIIKTFTNQTARNDSVFRASDTMYFKRMMDK